jgi:hypothetical protein
LRDVAFGQPVTHALEPFNVLCDNQHQSYRLEERADQILADTLAWIWRQHLAGKAIRPAGDVIDRGAGNADLLDIGAESGLQLGIVIGDRQRSERAHQLAALNFDWSVLLV